MSCEHTSNTIHMQRMLYEYTTNTKRIQYACQHECNCDTTRNQQYSNTNTTPTRQQYEHTTNTIRAQYETNIHQYGEHTHAIRIQLEDKTTAIRVYI